MSHLCRTDMNMNYNKVLIGTKVLKHLPCVFRLELGQPNKNLWRDNVL